MDLVAQRAIIAGVILAADGPDTLDEDLLELESLLATLGVDSVGRVVQKRQKFSPKTLLGEGKVQEIKRMAEMKNAIMVVFDHPLAPPQVRNLEKATGLQVLDRTGVILEIFAKHAQTTEAKTQVEIAQLEYLLPRMTGAWTHFQRQRGGSVRARGMGEKQIEVDRRRARERLAKLQKQLKSISKDKRNQRKARQNELKVALVGYTNSGKSTLMNAMTRAEVLAKDVLFATLDSNVRTLDPSTRPKILLSDTVGFIRNLPHGLVESFKSTLDEVVEADLLLHVVDVSHKNYKSQMGTTESVLEEIGAGDIHTMMIFNKMDQFPDNDDNRMLIKILKKAYPDSMTVSAYNDENIISLRHHLFQYFENNLVLKDLTVPADDQMALSLIYNSCLILESDFSVQNEARFKVRAAPHVLSKLEKFSRRGEAAEKREGY